MKRSIKHFFASQTILWLMIVIFGLGWLAVGLYKYYNWGYNLMDLGIINQTIWNSLQGHWGASSIHPPSYLGDHFNPIIGLILLVYWLWPGPQMLIIIQAFFFALCAWPIYRLASKLLPDEYKKYAWVASLFWLVNPVVNNLVFYEFHFMSLALFFSFWALDFYFADWQEKNLEKKKKYWNWFLVFILLLLLVREDMGFFVIMLGLVAILNRKSWKWVVVPILLGIAYFVLAGQISAHFNIEGHYKYLYHYQWMGGTFKEILLFPFYHPLEFISHFFKIGTWELNFLMLITFFILPIWGWRYLILLAPYWLQIILANKGGSALYLQSHYTAMWLPALLICSLMGFANIYDRGWIIKIENWLGLSFKKVILIFAVPIIVALFFMIGPLTGKPINVFSKEEVGWLNKVSEAIPQNSHLAVSPDLLSNFSSRPNLYNLYYHLAGQFQYSQAKYQLPKEMTDIVINGGYIYKDKPDSTGESLQLLLKSRNFGLVEVKNGLQYWRQNYISNLKLAELINNGIDLGGSNKKDFFETGLVFLDSHVLGLGNGLWRIETFWSNKNVLVDNYNLEVSWINKKSKVIQREIYPLGWGLYPTREWVSDQVVKINFWLSDIDDLDHWDLRLLNDDQISLFINKWIGGSWLSLDNRNEISNIIVIKVRRD